MPADRTHKGARRSKSSQSQSSKAGPSEPPKHKIPALEQRDGLMGVSKIKSQIRQTKRLLAKEGIEPGLRVNTQRRLTALEADLALAEKRAVEKKNGEKYHAVKFFERQKLVRLIKRAQRGLSELPAEEGEGEKEKKKAAKKAAKERTRLEKELFDARCMLNYIIHFPNTQKYIALFADRAEEGVLTLPPHFESEPTDGPEKKRREMLDETRKLMESGEISASPEIEKESKKRSIGEAALEDRPKEKKAKVDKAEAVVEDEDDFFEE